MTNRLARSGRTRLKEKSRDRHPVVTSPDLQILVPMTGLFLSFLIVCFKNTVSFSGCMPLRHCDIKQEIT